MASQPKPQTPPPAPKPPEPAPKPNPRAADHDYDHGDAKNRPPGSPEPVRDQRGDLSKIPGTPYTAPEGHDHAEPGPGQPGGPSAGAAGTLDPPVRTIADEQRERSEAMQGEGMQAWKDELDERDPDEKPKTVPGIQHRPVEEHEARGGRR